MRSSETDQPHPRRLPGSVQWLLLFQSCNASNFTIALGAPLILLARHLGASEFHIGVLSALPLLTVALQLFMTEVVDRIGYRRAMLMGWGTRSFMLLPVAALPFLVGKSSEGVLVTALLGFLLLFNVLRGVASGAWLPWLKHLLPEGARGTYFGLEQRIMNMSGFVVLLLCGWFLGDTPDAWRYSTIYFAAWGFGMASIYFLAKAPSVPPERRHSDGRTVWEVLRMAPLIWRHPPFRQTTSFVGVLTFAMMAVPAFLILFVKEELGWSEGLILKLQAVTTFGVLLTAVQWGKLSDRVGSRPLLRLGLTGQLFIVAFWMFTALGVWRPSVLIAGVAFLLYGVCAAAMAVSQMRLVLASSRPGETTVSMAYYQVTVALAGGLGPILWGAILGVLRQSRFAAETSYSLPFAVFFAGALAIGAFSHLLLARVREPKALHTGRLVLQAVYDWPIKVLSGVVFRGNRERP